MGFESQSLFNDQSVIDDINQELGGIAFSIIDVIQGVVAPQSCSDFCVANSTCQFWLLALIT